MYQWNHHGTRSYFTRGGGVCVYVTDAVIDGVNCVHVRVDTPGSSKHLPFLTREEFAGLAEVLGVEVQ
jgi:hypothetical protein